jgi:hypothetical protein
MCIGERIEWLASAVGDIALHLNDEVVGVE